ncbi:hypothetical protein [Salisediminibacterium halotolerans]|uniref:hypothetical protein n=1 Tax=Salisediminibacterium halotolerans TaxID=517425 RepID=UPI000EB5A2F9|nr:hypothetical protein [Salisediminibacterium halotolerans]RLJ72196.1 hypothetical protein BCL39_2087 [Actinophytocola xinjiangensis]RPE85409.1 hypothetical protein EDD67_2222 [Salisediminibacterium halotolerans]TWG33366.1 hypothetical protein BCL52_2084 [Salisediminibacterium halotolerans]GEL07105.1 hypothetical protein SHA02_05210 [Salisediminibacterium halotolerans]
MTTNANRETIERWQDLFISEQKKAGVVFASRDFITLKPFGLNDVNEIAQNYKGLEDCYITLNAFHVAKQSKNYQRTYDKLRQLRVIGIDIDQYDQNMSPYEAIYELQNLIELGEIPMPNLICWSRGVQVFYGLSGGAAPKKFLKNKHEEITSGLIKKLKHLGADANAKDLARFFRMPYTINSRNNTEVKCEIFEHELYTLAELAAYLPVKKGENAEKTNDQNKLNQNSHKDKNTLTRKLIAKQVNEARVQDLESLLKMRNGNMTRMRHYFLYYYGYHLAINNYTENKIYEKMQNINNQMYTNDPKADRKTDKKLKNLASSIFKQAEYFIKHFSAANFDLHKIDDDKAIRPTNSDNIIERLQITDEEQKQLLTLQNTPENKKASNANKKRRYRHKKGESQKTAAEYNHERKLQTEDKRKQILDLKKHGFTNIEIGKKFDLSPVRVSQIINNRSK